MDGVLPAWVLVRVVERRCENHQPRGSVPSVCRECGRANGSGDKIVEVMVILVSQPQT